MTPDVRTLGDDVFDALSAAITDGSLRPGQRLREVEVAEWFGVSRTPVRQAFQRLERLRLVDTAGARVTRVRRSDDVDRAHSLELESFEVPLAVRIAAGRMGSDDRARCIGALDEVIASVRSGREEDARAAWTRFRRTVVDGAGNRLLTALLRSMEAASGTEIVFPPGLCDGASSVVRLRGLRSAIGANDPDGAEAAARVLYRPTAP